MVEVYSDGCGCHWGSLGALESTCLSEAPVEKELLSTKVELKKEPEMMLIGASHVRRGQGASLLLGDDNRRRVSPRTSHMFFLFISIFSGLCSDSRLYSPIPERGLVGLKQRLWSAKEERDCHCRSE